MEGKSENPYPTVLLRRRSQWWRHCCVGAVDDVG
ncbi:hypothetical protein COLO4_38499 [Corchorus olitorius]|uniref:Uncharacterized protein n=1 Tax=Corchorus olitorius TaxID=93759 RepID=A0A1R3FUR5_9ROSI|nr:hypothetical protein COLO4_38499 [Corchorus olitorius]